MDTNDVEVFAPPPPPFCLSQTAKVYEYVQEAYVLSELRPTPTYKGR